MLIDRAFRRPAAELRRQTASESDFETTDEVAAPERSASVRRVADLAVDGGVDVAEIAPPFGRGPAIVPRCDLEPAARTAAVLSGARPAVILGSVDQSSADGVGFDIAQCRVVVSRVHGTGVIAALPDVPRSGSSRIDVRGVTAVSVAEGEPKRVGSDGIAMRCTWFGIRQYAPIGRW
jgi:hypothetical protein